MNCKENTDMEEGATEERSFGWLLDLNCSSVTSKDGVLVDGSKSGKEVDVKKG